jgi:hypothetical protein
MDNSTAAPPELPLPSSSFSPRESPTTRIPSHILRSSLHRAATAAPALPSNRARPPPNRPPTHDDEPREPPSSSSAPLCRPAVKPLLRASRLRALPAAHRRERMRGASSGSGRRWRPEALIPSSSAALPQRRAYAFEERGDANPLSSKAVCLPTLSSVGNIP